MTASAYDDVNCAGNDAFGFLIRIFNLAANIHENKIPLKVGALFQNVKWNFECHSSD